MERNRSVKSNYSWQWRVWAYWLISIIFIGFSNMSLLCNELSYKSELKIDILFLNAIYFRQRNEYTRSLHCLSYCTQIDSTVSTVWYELYKQYVLLHKTKQALDALQKAAYYNPDNFEYKIALINLYEKRENYNEAISLCEELVEKNQQNVELYYHLSHLYRYQKNYQKIIEILNKIEENIGITEAISFQRYQLYQLQGKCEEALKEMESLVKEFPTETKYLFFIGNFYLEKNEIGKAISCYKKALIDDPNNPDYIEALFDCYNIQGNQEVTIQEIEKSIKNSSLEMNFKFKMLKKYIENIVDLNKEKDRANKLFDTMIQEYVKNRELNWMYGKFLLSQNNKKEAKIQFQLITKFLPNDPYAWIELLNIAVQEKNLDETIVICEKALSYISDVPEFYFYRGVAFCIKKSYWKALKSYQEGLQFISKKNESFKSIFLGQIGDVYYQIGNLKKALYFYKRSIQCDPKNHLVLNNYAFCLSLNKKNLDKAEKIAKAAIFIDPGNIMYLDTYAYTLFKKKKYMLAKFYIEQANSINITNSEVLEHYGDILFAIGNKEKALSEWKKSLFLLKTHDQKKIRLLQKKITNQAYYE